MIFVYMDSRERGMVCLSPKLAQEAEVVGVEVADVVYART